MKNCYLIILVILSTGIGSCKKFLSESSQDEVRPTTTSDLNALLIGSAYPYKATLDAYIDLLTDDIECNGVPKANNQPVTSFNSYILNGYYIFCFRSEMFDRTELTMKPDQNSWFNYFKFINGCNLILDYVDKVEGSEDEKRIIQGQAYCLRAYYYFKLVNIYGRPYDDPNSDPAKNPAVPLILSARVSDERKARNTVKDVYDQIEKDLLQAEQLLSNYTNPGNFRIGAVAVKALLSRFYLYKGAAEDLRKSAEYATGVIAVKPNLTLLSTYFTNATTFSPAGIYDPVMSQEVIWNYGNNPNTSNLLAQSPYYPWASTLLDKLPPFGVSAQLIDLYEKGPDENRRRDLRYIAYFSKITAGTGTRPYRTGKIDPNSANLGSNGIRTAEMFLNRAEAIIRLNKLGITSAGTLDQALDDLNTLRRSRYDTRNESYQPVLLHDQEALWKFCQEERRRELCLEEGHRWFDIRRWHIPVHHRYIDIKDQVIESDLEAGSLLYALPIPYPAMENNASLIQNPRP